MIEIIGLELPPGKIMFWLEVSRVQFRGAFDRIPQWQSHLDTIDIAFDEDDDLTELDLNCDSEYWSIHTAASLFE